MDTLLCELADIETNRTWAELPRKNLNRLVEFIIRCPFEIKGKTTFKEEFVTCGGVDLKSVDLETMESKQMKGDSLCRRSAEHRWGDRWL